MSHKYYNSKKSELDDDAIVEALKSLPMMYERGELAEVEDICYEIYSSIQAFEMEGE